MSRPGEAPDPRPATSDDPIAAQLRGFGPLGVLAILLIVAGNLVIIPGSAALVLAWAARSHTPWRAIGFGRPRSWAIAALAGILFGVAFKLLLKAIVMPLLGADPVNQAYHYLAGNRAAIPGFLYTLVVGAGFGEETLYRGWLFERLGRLFGPARAAKPAILAVTSILFALAHYSVQGLAGSEQALITGLAFGAIYLATGTLWTSMFAHAAFDLTAYALIYWNLEARVAHWVFR